MYTYDFVEHGGKKNHVDAVLFQDGVEFIQCLMIDGSSKWKMVHENKQRKCDKEAEKNQSEIKLK